MIDNDCIITSKRCNAVDTGPSLTLWKVVAAILATGFITIAVVTWMPNVPVRSIAVMPFENLSGAESDQYLVSGFKEELVQTLHNKLVGKCTQTLIKSLPTDSEAYDSYILGQRRTRASRRSWQPGGGSRAASGCHCPCRP